MYFVLGKEMGLSTTRIMKLNIGQPWSSTDVTHGFAGIQLRKDLPASDSVTSGPTAP